MEQSACCGCFGVPGGKKKKQDPHQASQQFMNLNSLQESPNDSYVGLAEPPIKKNYNTTNMDNDHTVKGSNNGLIWKSQYDGKEGTFFMLGGNNGRAFQQNMNLTSSSQSENSDFGGNNSNLHGKHNQIVFDSVLRYFRFVCQKCKKGFKKILTNEVGTSIIQLEDTLNLPENHNCICPYCGSTLCNLLEIKNFISTYNMEEKLALEQMNNSGEGESSFDVKDISSTKIVVDQQQEINLDYQFKLDVVQEEQKKRGRKGGGADIVEIKKQTEDQSQEQTEKEYINSNKREKSPFGERNKSIENQDHNQDQNPQDESQPNTLIQEYFLAGNKGSVALQNHHVSQQIGLHANPNILQMANEYNQMLQEGLFKRVSAHSYLVKNRVVGVKQPVSPNNNSNNNNSSDVNNQNNSTSNKKVQEIVEKVGGVGGMGGQILSESEQEDSQSTSKMSNKQHHKKKKLNKMSTQQKKNIYETKIDESACKAFNADLMRALIARKMLRSKTFYELKVLKSVQLREKSAQMQQQQLKGGIAQK